MKTIVILGMHRSGTSMVSGILKRLGIDVGKDLLGKVKSNPFGHFEDRQFINMNKRILKSCGGSWSSPPSVKSILNQKKFFSDEIRKLVKKNQSDVWGWKEPRTTLTIELYLPHLNNPYFLVCYRNEMDIAKSLNKRNNMSTKESLKLTELYNKRIDIFFMKHQGFKKHDLYYDNIRKNPSKEIKEIIDFLDISPTSEELQRANHSVASNSKKQFARIKYLVITHRVKYLVRKLSRNVKVFDKSIIKRRNKK